MVPCILIGKEEEDPQQPKIVWWIWKIGRQRPPLAPRKKKDVFTLAGAITTSYVVDKTHATTLFSVSRRQKPK